MLYGEFNIKRKAYFQSYVGRHASWWDYYNNYREATVLIARSINQGTPIDTVALPILFLIKHSMELGLKANILEMEKFSTARDPLKLNSHELVFMYDTLMLTWTV